MSKTPTIREQIDQLLDDAYSMGRNDGILEKDDYHTLMPKMKEKAESLISQSVIEARKYDAQDLLMVNPECQACKANIEAQNDRIQELKTLANKGGES